MFVWSGQALRTSAVAQRAAVHPAVAALAATVFALSLGLAQVDLNLRVFDAVCAGAGDGVRRLRAGARGVEVAVPICEALVARRSH